MGAHRALAPPRGARGEQDVADIIRRPRCGALVGLPGGHGGAQVVEPGPVDDRLRRTWLVRRLAWLDGYPDDDAQVGQAAAGVRLVLRYFCSAPRGKPGGAEEPHD